MKSVLIIGCGWLGKITAHHLLNNSYKVTGTSRSEKGIQSLKKEGISPFKLEITPNSSPSLPPADVVLIAISPGRGGDRTEYVDNISVLANSLSSRNVQVIMCSSTSVYNSHTGTVTENDQEPDENSEHAILAAEGVIRSVIPETTILRLGGLFGYDRHPVHYLAGKKNIPRGDAPVNLVHADDIASIIQQIIESETFGEIFNVVSPHHPSRSELYVAKAKQLGLAKPEFDSGGKNEKVIDSSKVSRTFHYSFLHTNLLS